LQKGGGFREEKMKSPKRVKSSYLTKIKNNKKEREEIER